MKVTQEQTAEQFRLFQIHQQLALEEEKKNKRRIKRRSR